MCRIFSKIMCQMRTRILRIRETVRAMQWAFQMVSTNNVFKLMNVLFLIFIFQIHYRNYRLDRLCVEYQTWRFSGYQDCYVSLSVPSHRDDEWNGMEHFLGSVRELDFSCKQLLGLCCWMFAFRMASGSTWASVFDASSSFLFYYGLWCLYDFMLSIFRLVDWRLVFT